MPPRKRYFIIPRRLIELGITAVDTAEALSNPISLLKMVAKKGVGATLDAGDQAEQQVERGEAISELQAQMRYLDGHLVKVFRFFERNSDLPSGATIAQVPASEARAIAKTIRIIGLFSRTDFISASSPSVSRASHRATR